LSEEEAVRQAPLDNTDCGWKKVTRIRNEGHSMRDEYLRPRDESVFTAQRIYRYKMTTGSGGNLSMLDDLIRAFHL
jgi:hypothetical protein